MQELAAFMLMYIVYPLWVLAGFADWVCHRRTGIATTSGVKESLIHWLMFAEIGAAMLAVAFLEINAAVLAIVLAVFLVHEATVYWDLDYSTLKRDVGPFEQMVHSFLELLPLVSLALLAMIADRDDWSLRARNEPWPFDYLVAAAAASMLFNALPLLQETLSCARVRLRTRASPAPR
ncbi:MAG TPA: diguanylate cyclase [Ramlibacter sp.]|nr:diguanylate cyclase [Ramlibacter sp.]